VFALIAPMAR